MAPVHLAEDTLDIARQVVLKVVWMLAELRNLAMVPMMARCRFVDGRVRICALQTVGRHDARHGMQDADECASGVIGSHRRGVTPNPWLIVKKDPRLVANDLHLETVLHTGGR